MRHNSPSHQNLFLQPFRQPGESTHRSVLKKKHSKQNTVNLDRFFKWQIMHWNTPKNGVYIHFIYILTGSPLYNILYLYRSGKPRRWCPKGYQCDPIEKRADRHVVREFVGQSTTQWSASGEGHFPGLHPPHKTPEINWNPIIDNRPTMLKTQTWYIDIEIYTHVTKTWTSRLQCTKIHEVRNIQVLQHTKFPNTVWKSPLIRAFLRYSMSTHV